MSHQEKNWQVAGVLIAFAPFPPMASPRLALFFLALSTTLGVRAENAYRLLAAGDMTALNGRLAPGEVVLLPAATWDNATLTFRAHGTPEKPILLHPAHGTQFSLTGHSTLVIDGDWLVVEGIAFTDTESATGPVITIRGHHNQLTGVRVNGGAAHPFVLVQGKDHQIDHCRFALETSAAIALPTPPDKHSGIRVEQNQFIGCAAPKAVGGAVVEANRTASSAAR